MDDNEVAAIVKAAVGPQVEIIVDEIDARMAQTDAQIVKLSAMVDQLEAAAREGRAWDQMVEAHRG